MTANSAEPSVPWQQPDLFGPPAPAVAPAAPKTPVDPAVPKDALPALPNDSAAAAARLRPAASSPSLPPIQAASHT
ncbi:MAG: hypothetical protein ACKOZN_12050, partial [Cyanobium sp.]